MSERMNYTMEEINLMCIYDTSDRYILIREMETVLPFIKGGEIVSAKYSCGFPDPQVLPIIVVDRYLDYFTTIMEDRLWQVLAKPGFRWRNRSGLSMPSGELWSS